MVPSRSGGASGSNPAERAILVISKDDTKPVTGWVTGGCPETWARAGAAAKRHAANRTPEQNARPTQRLPCPHSARSPAKRELKLGRRFGATQIFLHRFTKRSISASWVANDVTRRTKPRSAPRSRFWLGRT